MATIVDGQKRIPFLRGMLTHYLLEHGFSFQEAYQVADRIRRATQERKKISAERMLELIHTHVQELFGDRPIGNGIFWAPGARQILVEDEGGSRPFSREHLANSLTILGVDEDEAYRAAERIGAEFIQQGRSVVRPEDIQRTALKLLKGDYGDAFAERYLAWHDFRANEQPLPLVVLIGGASGVGKTTAAVALANLLNISRMTSTDEIRQVMRLMIARDLMPTVHVSSYEAWETVTVPLPSNADPVIYAFREQATRINVGVRAVVERTIAENVDLVVDGVHLLPDLCNLKGCEKRAIIVRANLYLSDPQAYVERFETRGKRASRRPQHRYIEHLDKIIQIQEHILEVGEAFGVPAYENTDLDESVQSLSLQIMDRLKRANGSKKNGK